MIKKTLQPTNDMYLQFTEEELQTLNMKPGDKFEVKHHGDGSIELRPFAKLDLDMAEWPREALELIIKMSCEEDITVNEVINKLLQEALDDNFNSLRSEFGTSSHDAVLPTAVNTNYTTSSSDKLSTTASSDLNGKVLLNEFKGIDSTSSNTDTSITYSDYNPAYNIERDMLYSG